MKKRTILGQFLDISVPAVGITALLAITLRALAAGETRTPLPEPVYLVLLGIVFLWIALRLRRRSK